MQLASYVCQSFPSMLFESRGSMYIEAMHYKFLSIVQNTSTWSIQCFDDLLHDFTSDCVMCIATLQLFTKSCLIWFHQLYFYFIAVNYFRTSIIKPYPFVGFQFCKMLLNPQIYQTACFTISVVTYNHRLQRGAPSVICDITYGMVQYILYCNVKSGHPFLVPPVQIQQNISAPT